MDAWVIIELEPVSSGSSGSLVIPETWCRNADISGDHSVEEGGVNMDVITDGIEE